MSIPLDCYDYALCPADLFEDLDSILWLSFWSYLVRAKVACGPELLKSLRRRPDYFCNQEYITPSLPMLVPSSGVQFWL